MVMAAACEAFHAAAIAKARTLRIMAPGSSYREQLSPTLRIRTIARSAMRSAAGTAIAPSWMSTVSLRIHGAGYQCEAFRAAAENPELECEALFSIDHHHRA